MNEHIMLLISNAFNEIGGAYKRIVQILSPDVLTEGEVEELIDRLEAFIEQEVQEIIDERP